MSWFKRRYNASPLRPTSFLAYLSTISLCCFCFLLGFLVACVVYHAGSTHLSPGSMRELREAARHIDGMLDQEISLHIRTLEAENQRLRDSLAIYTVLEKAHALPAVSRVRVSYLSAKRVTSQQYEYHLLLVRDSTLDQNKNTTLPLIHLGFEATIESNHHLFAVPLTVPSQMTALLQFRYFHKIDGQFTVNTTVPLKSFTVFVYVGQHIVANQTFSFY